MKARHWILLAALAVALGALWANREFDGGREHLAPLIPSSVSPVGADELSPAATQESQPTVSASDPADAARDSTDREALSTSISDLRLRFIDGQSGAPLAGVAIELARIDPWRDDTWESGGVTDDDGWLELDAGGPGTFYQLDPLQLEPGVAESWRRFEPSTLRRNARGGRIIKAWPPALIVHASVGDAGAANDGDQPEYDLARSPISPLGTTRDFSVWEMEGQQGVGERGGATIAFFEEELHQPFLLSPRRTYSRGLKGHVEPLVIDGQRGVLSHRFDFEDFTELRVAVLEPDGAPAKGVVVYLVQAEDPMRRLRGEHTRLGRATFMEDSSGRYLDADEEQLFLWKFSEVVAGSWTLVAVELGSLTELTRKNIIIGAGSGKQAEDPTIQKETLQLGADIAISVAVSGHVRDAKGQGLSAVIMTCEFASGERISARSDNDGSYAIESRKSDEAIKVFPSASPWEGSWESPLEVIEWGSREVDFKRITAETARVDFLCIRKNSRDSIRGSRHIVVYREFPGGARPIGELLSCNDLQSRLSCPYTLDPTLRYVARVPGYERVEGPIPRPRKRGERALVRVSLTPGFRDSFRCYDAVSGVALAGVQVISSDGQNLGSSGSFGDVQVRARRWPLALVFEHEDYMPFEVRLDWDGLSEHWDGRIELTRAR